MKKKNNKDILEYNAPDLAQVWCDLYKEKHKEPYKLLQSDLGKMKRMSDIYGNYEMMLSIKKSIDDGDITVGYFESKIDRYLSNSDYVKYHYYIENCNSKEMKKLLTELYVLESRLLPSATSQARIDEIIGKFDDSISNK